MRVGRLLAGLLFGAIALSILAGTHLYLARRLVLEPELPEPARSIALAGLAMLGAFIFVLPFAERALPRRVVRAIVWPPSLWMGFMFLLLVALVVSDVALWIAGTPALAGVGDPSPLVTSARWRAASVVTLVGIVGAVAVVQALRGPMVRAVEISLRRWPPALDGFRIVQISDIHIGPILDRRFARDVVERCNALDPDLIAVTGDLVDGSARHLREEVTPFAELRARHGVYFVTGNHDHYSGAPEWVSVVAALGIRVLCNERVSIERNGVGFDLAGVHDHRGSFQQGWREDLDAALAGRDPARAVVLLAHDPTTFRRARELDVDLQLSGHTHGGQIWPFRYLVRLIVPWVSGLHRYGDAHLYVSCGTGFWGPPMRLGAPAEITELRLRSAAKGIL